MLLVFGEKTLKFDGKDDIKKAAYKAQKKEWGLGKEIMETMQIQGDTVIIPVPLSLESLSAQMHQMQQENRQLRARLEALESFVEPVAARYLVEKLRAKVWKYKNNNTPPLKTDRWNGCVEGLTDADLQTLHLTKESLQLTKYSDRPEGAMKKERPFNQIDEAASSTIHEADPAFLRHMVDRMQEKEHPDATAFKHLFECAFGQESSEHKSKKHKKN
ncbi:hypothetical protein EDD86DRAFT_220415 [Gorgonomyces haynaldii]|nr:hypothetical protein EDD86DRAFT_220415 [Gorgonomyces haynaldii]